MYHAKRARLNLFLSIMFLIGISSFIISGCASPAISINMVPTNFKALKTYDHSVKVEVSGGEETSGWGATHISNDAFMESIEKALTEYKVFSKILKEGDSEYLLEVAITELSQPAQGFDMEVHLVAHWSLKNIATNQIVWRDLISANYTATTGDALFGLKRLRLATEGAARKNIERGLKELLHQDL